jgi:putative ABC transport system ATP-binding protein
MTVILISMPFYFWSLDLPKNIVNGPIQGRGFATPDATVLLFHFQLDLPDWISETPVTLFSGFNLERLPALIALSMMFLGLVCVNGLFKFYINTYKGRLGERMLRRVRFELVDRVLRLPLPHLRRVKAAEVATMVKDEVEPLGGFIGDAFVQPMFLASQAATAMVFILIQNFWLGLIAASIVLVQTFIIPRLRKRLLVLGRQQLLTARELAGRVGEVVDGITEVRTNDTSNLERADIAHRLGRIFFIRYELYQRKFFVKFLNNFLAQVTPFLFFLVGGFFAIRGRLDIGQLVAVISAYKDLPPPIKELIDWDQIRQDVQIKYSQVVEQFSSPDILAGEVQAPEPGPVAAIQGPIEVSGLALIDDTGARIVENAEFKIAPCERIAAVGEINSGAESVGEALARLVRPHGGRVRLADRPLDDLPESVTGRRIAYVGPDSYLHNTTLRECLVYGLRHYPLRAVGKYRQVDALHASADVEAKAAGNIQLDILADWIDYDAAGVSGPDELELRILEVLKVVELDEDIFELGLRSRIDPANHDELVERILAARTALRSRLEAPEYAHLVEPFDPARYNSQATIAENLLFGATLDSTIAGEGNDVNKYVLSVLDDTGLSGELYLMGRQIATTVVELFAGLPPDHPFFEQLSFMRPDDLPTYEAALARVSGKDYSSVGEQDRAMLLSLAFGYIEPRHRMGLLDERVRSQILGARNRVRARLPAAIRDRIAFYEPDKYNRASSLEDNILFGRITRAIADGPRRVRDMMRAVLDELDIRGVVYQAGLDFNAGVGGKRLSTAQRQRIGLARALLKRPDLLIVNRGLSALGARTQRDITLRVLEEARGNDRRRGFAVFWVLVTPSIVDLFDRVLVFNGGKVAEDGKPAELLASKSLLKKIVG